MSTLITPYYKFKEFILDGTLDLNSNTFKLTLHTSGYTPSASTHTLFAHATNEVANGNGYSTGGIALSNLSLTSGSGTTKWSADNIVWTANGGSITARYAVLWASGTLNGQANPLVAFITLNDQGGTPTDVTVTDGNTLTVQWNTNGILTLT
jgi:hypothetical protein